jgi:uncharacterized OsmC-like protein
MADDLLITRVHSQSTGIPGRSLNSARTNHFVIDGPAYGGGPNEAITPAEAFLAGISGCGVILVEKYAAEENTPLAHVAVGIEGTRSTADPANFSDVRLRFTTRGVSQPQAEHLVERYKQR